MWYPKRLVPPARLLALLALGAAAAANALPAVPSENEVADLLRRLADDEFATRERAQKALVQIGKPALGAVKKALRTSTDADFRRRAREIVEEIDPGGSRREALDQSRAVLRKAVAAVKGVDVTHWAESIANPFADLTAEARQRLTAEGIDVPRMQKMRARYLRGGYGGACRKEFVNPDPDTVLVVGKGFVTHGGVYSAGPVLAVEDAYFMSRVTCADLLWFVDRAGASGGVTGAPVLAAEGAGAHAVRATVGILVGDYGWRPPKNFLRPLTAADAGNDPPPTEELAQEKKALAERVKKATEGKAAPAIAPVPGARPLAEPEKKVGVVDVAQVAREVANPFAALTDEGKAKLKLRGIDTVRLPKLKAVYLTGNYCGAWSKDFVNNDPDTVLVIGKGFITHGQVYSLGPILAIGDAHFMGDVTGADLVWFGDRSFPRGRTAGAPVILAPTAEHSQMTIETRYIWYGDYGWRAPADFPKGERGR